MRRRLPLAISLLALAVALLGATPALQAAAAVKRALFADNAGAVNGIKASKTAKPNQLLALDAKGRFPASALAQGPAGPIGPPGPQGQRGVAGVDGVSGAILRTHEGSVAFPTAGNGQLTVVSAADVPAGSYVGVFTADINNFLTQQDAFHCQLQAPIGTSLAESTTWAGGTVNGAQHAYAAVAVIGNVTLAAATTVTVRCYHETVFSSAPQILPARLLLLRAPGLDAAAG